MKRVKEVTIAQYFVDSGFTPPKGKSLFDFGFGFDSGVEGDMEMDGYDGIPDTIADITKDLNDASEHPAPGIYADYYMFNDPGTRMGLSATDTLVSNSANQLNMDYRKKDLSRIESASDTHLESLEQPSGEFPRHNQIKSQMEPSVLLPQDPIMLDSPTMIEGSLYPTGTTIRVSRYTESEIDALYENPKAKLCPLCNNPYVGDACICVKSGQPQMQETLSGKLNNKD